MAHTITLIPGDGIGPEVTAAVIRIFTAAGLEIEWDRQEAGVIAFKRFGQSLPPALLESVKRNKVALKGPVTTPIGEGFTSVNVGLRKALDLFSNLRPVKHLPGVSSRFEDVDLIIVRENTEDLYAGLEHEIVPGIVESIKIITERASTRIARFAFEFARTHGRKRVTAIHKANCFLMTDGLFMEAVHHVAKEFPQVELDDLLVDASTAHLVRTPERFDVICATNFFGDILSDLASELSGSLGLAGSVNASATHCCAQAQHGSAPDIAGQNVANPTSMILSVAMLLNWMGTRYAKPAFHQAASAMEQAVDTVLANPATRTRDLGGKMKTDEFGHHVARAI